MNKVYAYAWFRRPRYAVPGNWTSLTPGQYARLVHQLYKDKTDDPGAGNVLRGSDMDSRYDYIYVKIEVPPAAFEGLEEV